MLNYFAYGLRVKSEIPLSGLSVAPSEDARPDVEIRLGVVTPHPPEDAAESYCYLITPTTVCMRWLGVAIIRVANGREITVEPSPGIAPAILRLYLLGAGMGILLHQRGRFLLHGSAVDVHGAAIAFLGDCGAGKSTTAAAFYRRGHALVTDDVVSLDLREGTPLISRAYPVLRLCPDAAENLGRIVDVDECAQELHPLENKHLCAADREFLPQIELPLHRIYVLADAEEIRIRPLTFQEAFVPLLRNSYTSRLLLRSGAAKLHFHQSADLAGMGLVRMLERPRRFDQFDALIDAIKTDANTLRESAHV